MLATEQRRIAGQDLLDSIEDRADDEDLAKRLAQIDATQRLIEQAVDGYLAKMLQFSDRGRRASDGQLTADPLRGEQVAGRPC